MVVAAILFRSVLVDGGGRAISVRIDQNLFRLAIAISLLTTVTRPHAFFFLFFFNTDIQDK
jgi:hypothetical protein